jgi:hypothetical protein
MIDLYVMVLKTPAFLKEYETYRRVWITVNRK